MHRIHTNDPDIQSVIDAVYAERRKRRVAALLNLRWALPFVACVLALVLIGLLPASMHEPLGWMFAFGLVASAAIALVAAVRDDRSRIEYLRWTVPQGVFVLTELLRQLLPEWMETPLEWAAWLALVAWAVVPLLAVVLDGRARVGAAIIGSAWVALVLVSVIGASLDEVWRTSDDGAGLMFVMIASWAVAAYSGFVVVAFAFGAAIRRVSRAR